MHLVVVAAAVEGLSFGVLSIWAQLALCLVSVLRKVRKSHPLIPWVKAPRSPNSVLGRTYGGILDFSFGGRTENRYEMTLELVSGADFTCVLHHLSSLTRLEGSLGQVWPENGPKPKLKFIF